ncbi:hypothetical protein Btru_054563 [Bulinus truncatus]|nr:hypothetical protein Btru_054563 [Bulinus truncatus]
MSIYMCMIYVSLIKAYCYIFKNIFHEEAEIAKAIQRYYLWVLGAIGIPANFLALIVIVTMQKMTTASFLIAAPAICDSCALESKLIYVNLFLHNVLSETLCKMDFMSGFLSSLANWTLVLICVERFVSVCYPLKKEYLVTLRLCYVVFGVAAVILLVFRMTVVITMRYYYNDSEGMYSCETLAEYKTFYFGYWHWINNSLVVFIPYVLISTFTTVIIVKLRVNAVQRRRTLHGSCPCSSPNSNSFNSQILHENERAERAITWMLAFTAVLFLVLTLPACVFFLMYREDEQFLFLQIQFVLHDSTHALNFFMYFLTAKRFRLQLYQIFRCERLREILSRSKRTTETPLEVTP